MALSNMQERVERSIYEAIRLVLVEEGYTPDILLYDTTTPSGRSAYQDKLQEIVDEKGFCITLFGHGSSQKKYAKVVPRIVLLSRKILPGDIGNPHNPVVIPDPNDPNKAIEVLSPQETAVIHQDINLVSGGDSVAQQDRVMNAVIAKALGSGRGYIPFVDTNQPFFIRQYNYYDLPNTIEGIEEKVYSYEVPDLYLAEPRVLNADVSRIKEIEVDFYLGEVKPEPDDSLVISSFIKIAVIDSNYIPGRPFFVLNLTSNLGVYNISQVFNSISELLSYLNSPDFLGLYELTGSFEKRGDYIYYNNLDNFLNLELFMVFAPELLIFKVGNPPDNLNKPSIAIANGDTLSHSSLQGVEVLSVHRSNIYEEPITGLGYNHSPIAGELSYPPGMGPQDIYLYVLIKPLTP